MKLIKMLQKLSAKPAEETESNYSRKAVKDVDPRDLTGQWGMSATDALQVNFVTRECGKR
ncbi:MULTISPECIES: hypothetical protein [Hahella]|uniref:Uncharacterized protein n=1 Tax=Hahella chejuensis (strain KCTC 2396) TaxID=349521 RepID=Q2SIX6_HAHCH|nr:MULTISPECIES: hypothetical protein [Hahella]ABC29398.1 hypothetical protein HCH_02606 [Hahella chejuensis KCTC 2396]AZZ93093.1 hypothetical protein ENC22_18510 [Hahella sp. KA22]MBU6950500.1 hypothetical protein [Hahella sp. HN01]MDG9667959.1 hypothetical protein [Hahella sp. CR1]QAY56467.1 hypothetical protein EUZ85_21095 [Hahella sp. KA22]